MADRILAGRAERGEMFFRAHQDPAGSRSCRGTVLVDIRLAGFTHGGGSHQRRLESWKCASIHSARALRCGCAAWQNFVASRIQAAMTVTYCAKAEGIESCSNNAKVKVLAM